MINQLDQRNQKLKNIQQKIQREGDQISNKYEYYFIIIEAKHKLTQDKIKTKIDTFEQLKEFMKEVKEYKSFDLITSSNNNFERKIKKYKDVKATDFRNFVDYYDLDKFCFEHFYIFFGSPYIEKNVLYYIKKINKKIRNIYTKNITKNILSSEKISLFSKLQKYNLISLSGNRYNYYTHHQLRNMMAS